MFLMLLFLVSFSALAKDIPWDAQEYCNNSYSQQQIALSYVQKLEIKDPHSILDIGCGDGKITAYLAQKYPQAQVIGVDNSSDMINFARDKFSTIPNLSFVCSDAAKISYVNQFDLIVSFFCLHWVTDQQSALKALAKAAKPNADILLLFSIDPDQPLLKALRYAHSVEPFSVYFKDYVFPVHPLNPQKTIALLATNNCTLISYHVDEKTTIFNTVRQFYDFLHEMPLVDVLKGTVFDVYMSIIVTQYLSYCPLTLGKICYASPIGIVHMQKK